ncbi:MAG: nuclear transport factor 2 family protein [Acetobacteraceae bacterium]
MFRRWVIILACLLAVETAAGSAHAGAASDRAAITDRLLQWTAAFNARDSAGIRDLFAADLVSTVPGALDGSRAVLCARLDALLAKPELQLHYDNPDIKEIIVFGDIAVVRLFWTLTTRKGAEQDVTAEAGIDVFERQTDGKWSIARLLSFTTRPNKNL